jgi:hypothetical protein
MQLKRFVTINNSFDELVPEAKTLRRKQSGLLYAQEGLATAAAKEGGVLSRTLNNIMRVVGANRDIAFAISGLAGGALGYSTLATPIAGAAAVAGGAYLLSKPVLKFGLDATKSRKNLSVVLKGVDNAIKAAKDSPQMVKQLRADRALLIELVTDLEQVWREGGKEAYLEEQKRLSQEEPLERDPDTGEVIIRITK